MLIFFISFWSLIYDYEIICHNFLMQLNYFLLYTFALIKSRRRMRMMFGVTDLSNGQTIWIYHHWEISSMGKRSMIIRSEGTIQGRIFWETNCKINWKQSGKYKFENITFWKVVICEQWMMMMKIQIWK